jgi:hypothetical protein
MEPEERKTSPWVFVGVGCVLAVFLLIFAIGGLAFWGFRQVRQFQETMENPVARTERAQELLAAEQIPAGYHAVVALSIPFLMETVVLSDRAPDESGQIEGFEERGFIYFKTLAMGEQEQELRDFFAGRTEDSQILDQSSVRVNAEEVVGRGLLEETGRTLHWVSYRGEINARGSRESAEGLSTMVMFECPGAERVRMGIWFGPDPDPEAAPGDADFTGSVADDVEIQRFMRNFDVCSR